MLSGRELKLLTLSASFRFLVLGSGEPYQQEGENKLRVKAGTLVYQ